MPEDINKKPEDEKQPIDKKMLNEGIKKDIQSDRNFEEYTKLNTKLNSIVEELNTIKANKTNGTISGDLSEKIETLTETVSLIASKLNNNEKFEAVAEIIEKNPELYDFENNKTIFSIDQPIEKIRDEASRILEGAKKVAAKHLEQYEKKLGRFTALSRPVTQEEIDRHKQKTIEDLESGDPERNNRAASDLFWQKFRQVTS